MAGESEQLLGGFEPEGPQQGLPISEQYQRGGILPLGRPGWQGVPFARPGLELALPEAFIQFADAVDTPRQAYAGELGETEVPDKVANFVGTFMSPSTLARPRPDTFGIMGGNAALGADREALIRALDMEANANRSVVFGSPAAKNIWKETGWYRGVDGKWRFEISDEGAKLLTDKLGKGTSTDFYNVPRGAKLTLKDILDHPELYKHYPELMDMPVNTVNLREILRGTKGSMSGAGMRLGAQSEGRMLNTILHEIQHAVQAREGFARGGYVREFLPPNFADLEKRNLAGLTGVRNEIRAAGFNPYTVERYVLRDVTRPSPGYLKREFDWAGQNPGLMERFKDLLAEHKSLVDIKNEAYKSYTNLAGEVEAVLPGERLKGAKTGTLNLKEVAPWETPGYVPAGDQWVKHYVPGENPEPWGWGAQEMDKLSGEAAQFGLGLEPVEHNPFDASKWVREGGT